MIIVRPYIADDKLALDALQKLQGFEYEAPDWNQMILGGVLEQDGKVEMAIMLRKTCEAFFLLDSAGKDKLEVLGKFMALHKEMIPPALAAGFTDVHCWIPPEIEVRFGNLLRKRMEWNKQLWPCYSRELR